MQQLQPLTNPLPFILAGKAIFTCQNIDTQNRYTYKVYTSTKNKNLLIVSVLIDHQYKYIGIITNKNLKYKYTYSRKSEVPYESTEVKGFYYIFNKLLSNTLPEVYKIYHYGKCGRCGRTLTTPESIQIGFGSECVKYIGLSNN